MKNIIKPTLFTLFLTFILFSGSVVLAEDATPASSLIPRQQRLENRQQERQVRVEERQQNLMILKKDRAYQEIDRRIKALNALIGRINNIKRLTSDQKANLVAQVQQMITDLNNLRVKIEADTDPAVLKADKQSIVNAYRTFVLFMPKIQIMAHADRIIAVADFMVGKTTNADALAKINEAKTIAQNTFDGVAALKPGDYPVNKTVLQTARETLQETRKLLNDARKLMKTE